MDDNRLRLERKINQKLAETIINQSDISSYTNEKI